mgnify:CR=1 FL=1
MASATKQALLAALSAAQGECISGQQLARQLGVSRAAVHKAAAALAAQGYALEAAPRRGYRLAGGDPFCAEAVGEYDAPIFLYDTLESSNRTAKTLALEGAPHGTMVLAGQQTAGRGRLGRRFESPAGKGVYLSLVLRPSLPMTEAQAVTVSAAVAVCRAVKRLCGLDLGIKWVNDLYYNGKKVCGILTEGISDFETGQIEHLILGIGINTTVKDFPAELLATAGAAEGTYSKSALAAETITQALGYIEDLDSASFLPAYKEKSLVIGKTVTVYQGRYKVNPEDEITGVPARVLDIADDGGLIVLYADGHQEKLVSGEISIRI